MRITLDTNVLVSAFISRRGHSADILDMVATFQEITLVLSDEILEEFVDVISRDEVKARFGYSETDVHRFERAIREVAEIVKVTSDFRVVREDPEDDVVLNTAHDGKADYIVSGDKHLKKLRRFKGVRILSPSAFMVTITKKFGELVLSESDLERLRST
jgi:putative PIN family toxin of toxin-antitoxin system